MVVVGDQRGIYLSKKITNRRKIRRPSAKKFEAKKPLEERVFYNLLTGKLNDYVHNTEKDPFLGVLYRQYEYLRYIEWYYRACILRGIIVDMKQLDLIIETLLLIRRKIKIIRHYFVNGLRSMYGSVMNKKFYGWFEYIDRFVSAFDDVSLSILHKLSFDPNKTRVSVYFFQSYWIRGLSVKSNISEYLKTYQSTEDMSRSERGEVEGFREDFSDVLDKEKGEEENIEDLPYMMGEDGEWEDNYEDTLDMMESKLLELYQEEEETNDQNFERQFIRNLLRRAGLDVDILYHDMSNTNINQLASFLLGKIRNKVIKLTEEELEYLHESKFSKITAYIKREYKLLKRSKAIQRSPFNLFRVVNDNNYQFLTKKYELS